MRGERMTLQSAAVVPGRRDFEIVPHRGVGPIELGMTRRAVHSMLGTPEHSRDRRDGFLGGFFVDFDSNGQVEFIELATSPFFRALFNGVCLHAVEAEDAVAHVSKFGTLDAAGSEPGYSFVFIDLQLSLWRDTIPLKGQSPDDPAGRHFEAVGIAVDDYFRAGQ
jgi:hypothetical protein